jgi:hypothetical protein
MLLRAVLTAALAFVAVAALSDAQAQSSGNNKKMYKWTDQQGNVHYSDQIPPEAKEYARERFSERGVSVERIERAQTPEEIAAQQAAEEKALADAKAAEERRKSDEALLNSYANEDDLVRAYNQRVDLLDQTVEARRIEIGAREQSLSQLVAQAAEMERSGKVVSDALKEMISNERLEIERQKEFLKTKEGEKELARVDYERDLARYKAALARVKQNEQQ